MTPDPLDEEFLLFKGKTAAVLGGIFLAVFVICAVLVGVDRAHRPQLETLRPATAHPGP